MDAIHVELLIAKHAAKQTNAIRAKMAILLNIRPYHPDIVVLDVWPIANHAKIIPPVLYVLMDITTTVLVKNVIAAIHYYTVVDAHPMASVQPASPSSTTWMEANVSAAVPLTTTAYNAYQPINASVVLTSTIWITTNNAPLAASSTQAVISAANSNIVLVV